VGRPRPPHSPTSPEEHPHARQDHSHQPTEAARPTRPHHHPAGRLDRPVSSVHLHPPLHRRRTPTLQPARPTHRPATLRRQQPRLGHRLRIRRRRLRRHHRTPRPQKGTRRGESRHVRRPARLPSRPIQPQPRSLRRPRRHPRRRQRPSRLRDRTRRHRRPGRPHDAAIPRRVRRIRTKHDHRQGEKWYDRESQQRPMGRRHPPLRLPRQPRHAAFGAAPRRGTHPAGHLPPLHPRPARDPCHRHRVELSRCSEPHRQEVVRTHHQPDPGQPRLHRGHRLPRRLRPRRPRSTHRPGHVPPRPGHRRSPR
jgi:hypothetical protein